MVLSELKKDPSPILLILERLKNDPSETVRRSVANNLNDISKNNPDVVIRLAKEWYGENEEVNRIVKHGLRTLLKKGDRDVLAIFGYANVDSAELNNFRLETPSISIGGDMVFSFEVSAKAPVKVRFEYEIGYVKANGKRNGKIFQISEIGLKENEIRTYTRKHSFADVSVRKHYTGIHTVTLIVNGVRKETLEFEVK
jgi:hypothetical protein